MKGHPVSQGSKERNYESDPHDEKKEKYAKDPLLHWDRGSLGIAIHPTAGSS
jgi:hypothetical protein